MNRLAISALVIVAAVAVQGSLFGPFGPFGQAGVAALPAFGPAFRPPAFGPPALAQPGFFPGYSGYPSVPAPAVFPSFGTSSGFVPALLASRALLPAAAATPQPFRTKPSPAVNRLLAAVDLPADLQRKLSQLLAENEEGNAACDTNYSSLGALAWLHRRCVAVNKGKLDLAARALELEVANRAAEQAAAEQAAAELAAQQAAADQAAADQAAAEQTVAEQVEEEAAVTTGEAEAVEEPTAEVVEESVNGEKPVAEVEVEESAPTANEAVVVDEETTTAA